MIRATLAVALALVACREEGGNVTGATAEPSAAKAVPAAPVFEPAAAARKVKEESELLEFTYGWPSQAAAIPLLRAQLERDMAAQRKEATAAARADKAERTAEIPFTGHWFSKVWKLHGDSGRLLSLAAEISTFTGGAHGNEGFEAILWDRSAGRAIAPGDLFRDRGAGWAALGRAYCPALNQARAKKREEPLPLEGDEWLTGCPPLAKQTVAPVDGDGDGRFELLRVLIPPYEAGPYAEGSYEVDVPVTAEVKALVRPEYRASF
ncbi:MAG TPA: DUF4163 domain-containing protein [Allosphingosinicella sp.]|nr:DUF4163 domain-containing protein [Allosphingosinicella sp.]